MCNIIVEEVAYKIVGNDEVNSCVPFSCEQCGAEHPLHYDESVAAVFVLGNLCALSL